MRYFLKKEKQIIVVLLILDCKIIYFLTHTHTYTQTKICIYKRKMLITKKKRGKNQSHGKLLKNNANIFVSFFEQKKNKRFLQAHIFLKTPKQEKNEKKKRMPVMKIISVVLIMYLMHL